MFEKSRFPERDEAIINAIACGLKQAEAARHFNIPMSVVVGVVRRYREAAGKPNFARTRQGSWSRESERDRRARLRTEKAEAAAKEQAERQIKREPSRLALLFAEADRLIMEP